MLVLFDQRTQRAYSQHSSIDLLRCWQVLIRGFRVFCNRYDRITHMADFKSRPGTFLPYMEESAKPARSERGPASPLTLLGILNRQSQQSLLMFDLQTLSGMEPARYAEALKSLQGAGYISIDGQAPEQSIRLTSSGANVVQLAQPA